MECKTYSRRGDNKIISKVKYETFSDAQAMANNFNKRKKIKIEKVVYKCKKCKKFHVGTGTNNLPKVETEKVGVIRTPHVMKVVGTIDLSKFQPKEIPQPKSTTLERATILITKKDSTTKKIKQIQLLVGRIQLKGEVWKYYSKKKVVKIIAPNGRVRMIKKLKISSNAKIQPDTISISRNSIITYIEKNNELML